MRVYSLADNADDAERMQQAAFISQRLYLEVIVVIVVIVVCLRLSACSARDIGVSLYIG